MSPEAEKIIWFLAGYGAVFTALIVYYVIKDYLKKK